MFGREPCVSAKTARVKIEKGALAIYSGTRSRWINCMPRKKTRRLSTLIAILQKDQDHYGDVQVSYTLSSDMLAQVQGAPTAAIRRFSGQYTVGGKGAKIEESSDWGKIRMEYD